MFERLIDLLIEQQRLSLFPKILGYVVQFYYETHDIMEFTIESSHPLDIAQLQEIVVFLEQKTGKKIIYTTLINKELIAGIKLFSTIYGWEHSVRKYLRALGSIA
jgi:F0F1-type ATP synthase delta subunit